MTLEEVIEFSAEHNPREDHVHALVLAVNDAPARALGTLSLEVARRYMSGEIAFEVADAILNSMFAYASSVLGQWPEPMYSVFLAFDSGEHRHSEDTIDIDPVLKYTRPQLAEILKNQHEMT